MFVLMADVPLQKVISRAARRHEVGLTWANYQKCRRYGLSAILNEAHKRRTRLLTSHPPQR